MLRTLCGCVGGTGYGAAERHRRYPHIRERAEKNGQLRLAEMNTRTADDLTAIITSHEHDDT
ncbi:hypothetical protein [Nocardia sp. 348MFTsu5.1]|uniref:hypothetical protein n=1 Tax=Nocardia sp. 348MFTsu5.1 TaxID=1172185 RepID=UPI0003621594|nr:hypothetical protein [Nocardia sp. 348MFTsu5.1]